MPVGTGHGDWWPKRSRSKGEENPRYLVTSLAGNHWPPQKLYVGLYCARVDTGIGAGCLFDVFVAASRYDHLISQAMKGFGQAAADS